MPRLGLDPSNSMAFDAESASSVVTSIDFHSNVMFLNVPVLCIHNWLVVWKCLEHVWFVHIGSNHPTWLKQYVSKGCCNHQPEKCSPDWHGCSKICWLQPLWDALIHESCLTGTYWIFTPIVVGCISEPLVYPSLPIYCSWYVCENSSACVFVKRALYWDFWFASIIVRWR